MLTEEFGESLALLGLGFCATFIPFVAGGLLALATMGLIR